MVSAVHREGIHVNQKSNQVLRVGTGVPPPEGSHRVKLTDNPNALSRALRQLAQERSMSAGADTIQWA